MLLVVFFWLIAYQNLPGSLNGLPFKPFDTSGFIDRLVKVGTIAIGFSIIIGKWSLTQSLVKHVNPGLILFMILAPLSALWSIDSAATLLRSTTLAGIVLMCIAISMSGWNRQRFLQIALPPTLFILVLSLLIGMVDPDRVLELGTDISLKDAWHGITHQKNQFGMTASVVTILCYFRWTDRRGSTAWSLVGVFIGLACLLLSRSSSSLLATIAVCGFITLMMRVQIVKQRYSTLLVVGLASLIIVYELAVQNLIPGMNLLLSPIASLTGKDTTFSARSQIWAIIRDHIQQAPLLGSGYGAYWTTLPTKSSPSYIFVYLMYFYPSESHNGYLEIMNDLGIAGLLCLAVFLVYFVRQGLQLLQFDRGQAVMYLAVFFQQMIANLSESEWFSRSTICMVLLLATACLSRDVLEYQKQSRSGPQARH